MSRSAAIERNTKETQIAGTLEIDGQGQYEIATGIRFLDHMLELFTRHGGFDLKLHVKGDLDVDGTMNLVADVGFDQSFSFIYSRRPGTPAAALPDGVLAIPHALLLLLVAGPAP